MPVKTYDTRAQEADLYHRGHSAYDQGSGFSDLSGRPERVISVSLPRGLIATKGDAGAQPHTSGSCVSTL